MSRRRERSVPGSTRSNAPMFWSPGAVHPGTVSASVDIRYLEGIPRFIGRAACSRLVYGRSAAALTVCVLWAYWNNLTP